MKKVFETPAMEIMRMQVSEELTVSGNEYEKFDMFMVRTTVEDWSSIK